MTLRPIALIAVLALAACKPAAPAPAEAPPTLPPMVEPAGCTVSSPAEGSPERAAIQDALRPTVESMTGKPVAFTISRLDVACDYARIVAAPASTDGANQYESIDAMMVRKNGAWALGMVAALEEDSPPAGEQYKAKYADAAAGLVN